MRGQGHEYHAGDQNAGASIYHVELNCDSGSGLKCPSDAAGKEVNCVVCTK